VIDVALLVAHVHASHGDHVSIVPKLDLGLLGPNGIQYPDPGCTANVHMFVLCLHMQFHSKVLLPREFSNTYPQYVLPIMNCIGILNHLAPRTEVQRIEPPRIIC